MKKANADKLVAKYRHMIHYLHYDTRNQVLIDLYISFQDNCDDAYDSRMAYKQEISNIIASFRTAFTKDRINYEVVSNVERWVDEEVLTVLNFILHEDCKSPGYIPEIFLERLSHLHISLSVEEFYRYKN